MRHETLQLSGIAALLSGACIALIPLNSIAENLVGVAVAFTLLNLSSFLFKLWLKVPPTKKTENTLN